MLWLVLALMTLLVLGFVLRPLLRARPATAARADFDLAIYRQQLDEIALEIDRGTLGTAEAAAAKLEIEHRMLRAGEAAGQAKPGRAQATTATAIILAILVPALALPAYLWLGQPSMPSVLFADRSKADTGNSEQQQIAGMIGKLETKLQQHPEDARGWSLLGRSYVVLERYDQAVEAYRHASELAADDPDLAMAYGEAQVFAAKGDVTPGAVKSFERTLTLSPKHPGARYYLALARAQAGDMQAAFDQWKALYADSPADAPWQAALQDRLRDAAGALKIDLATALPKPLPPTAASAPPAAAPTTPAPGPTAADVAAAQKLSPQDQSAMIRGMVEKLAAKMQQDPGNFDGWMRLGQAYGVLGEHAKAKDAFAKAAALRPTDAGALTREAGAVLELQGAVDDHLPAPAETLYRQALALDPDNPEALWYVGIAEQQAGRPQQAAAHWRRLLSHLDPKSADYAEVSKRLAALGK